MENTLVVDFKMAAALEQIAEKALEDLLAIDVDNGVRTSDLAKRIIKKGYPVKDVYEVSRKLNALAKQLTGTKANYIRKNEKTGENEKFVGTTWVGSLVAHEPWNQYIWHLPFWQNVNLIGPRPQMEFVKET